MRDVMGLLEKSPLSAPPYETSETATDRYKAAPESPRLPPGRSEAVLLPVRF